jgi:hypothetical protein
LLPQLATTKEMKKKKSCQKAVKKLSKSFQKVVKVAKNMVALRKNPKKILRKRRPGP